MRSSHRQPYYRRIRQSLETGKRKTQQIDKASQSEALSIYWQKYLEAKSGNLKFQLTYLLRSQLEAYEPWLGIQDVGIARRERNHCYILLDN
jgi:hypothetical protein